MIGGTPAIPAIYTARAGWEIRREPRRRRASARNRSARPSSSRARAQARGFTVNTPREDAARGGTICFDFDGAEAVSRELCARRFFHDYRPRCGLRVSPHFYTTDDELDAFVRELDTVRRR